MRRKARPFLICLLISSTLLTGCQPMQPYYLKDDGDLSHYVDVGTKIEYTDAGQRPIEEVAQSHQPRTISNPQFDEFWDLTLEEVINYAVHNSKVFRSIGAVRQFGQVVAGPPERLSTVPDGVGTIYDPAIQDTGQGGVEQALATFDTLFNSTATWESFDRPQNFNQGQLTQPTDLQQDVFQFNNEFSKQAATGTQFFLRNVNTYTGANNALTAGTRSVPSDWLTSIEAEFRHPLLRNRGAQVNRIPVVLARIRTDLSLIDFMGQVVEMLNAIEQSYWELYYFYNNLRAAQVGRDSAQAAYQKVQALYDNGNPGGEAEAVSRAKEQYFFFRARVEEAQRDLFKSETRLRYMMGLTPTDHRLIRPADTPARARVNFEWPVIKEEALSRRGEIIRQGWRIKQRELELIAARNQLLPQFDIVGLYRWLGVGDEFDTSSRSGLDFPNVNSSAVDQFFEGDNQEFRVGFEVNVPLGFRRELAQVRSSQLSLARERAKLEDMQLEIVHQLNDAVQEVDAQHQSLNTNYQRRIAADEQVAAIEAAYNAGETNLDMLLDAQRRQADAHVTYYQAEVDYNLALARIHLRKGSLLDYNGVMLAEGPWPAKAYFDAMNEARRRDASYYLDYGFSRPKVVSRGEMSAQWSQGERRIDTIMPNDLGPNDEFYEDGDVIIEGEDLTDMDPSALAPQPSFEELEDSNNGDIILDSPVPSDAADDPIQSLQDAMEDTLRDAQPPRDFEQSVPLQPEIESDLQLDDLEASRPRRSRRSAKTARKSRSNDQPASVLQVRFNE